MEPTSVHRGSLFLSRLAEHDLRRLAPYLRLKEFCQDQVIYRNGDAQSWIIFPHDTTISMFIVTTDGRTAETANIGTDGYVGVETILGSTATAFDAVARAGRASYVMLDRLLALIDESPSLRTAMLSYAHDYLITVSRLAACNALHSIKQRLCRRLLLSYDHTTVGALAVTQDALARALGVRRTSVNSICKELRQENIIEYRRGNIWVSDKSRMEASACECYGFLNQVLTKLSKS